ncbi:hypothetical protein RB195_007182 [Necator americanus]|uniref:Uncharacterized protein n=2 Tax=Necator americanus TaxID=51031 RepID=A0ABR1BYL0_NECAM|nr:hypothetical protein NECAME_10227 [Necator americanus]ETN78622.1 hypothetical protein NECAME_10227 [Necator americanus]
MKKRDPAFLDPRETFEHYENRSRPTSSQSFEPSGSRGVLACEYRAAPPPGHREVLACEYRASPTGPHEVLGCQYRAEPPDVRYHQEAPARYQPSPESTKITTYLPESNKRKIPLGVILSVALGVPVVLVVCLFGAVWLQELGIL